MSRMCSCTTSATVPGLGLLLIVGTLIMKNHGFPQPGGHELIGLPNSQLSANLCISIKNGLLTHPEVGYAD